MRVGVEMFFAVLIVAVAFGAEPELHLGTVHLCPAADRTLMLRDSRVSAHIPFKLLPAVNLLRIQVHHIPRCQEEHHKV